MRWLIKARRENGEMILKIPPRLARRRKLAADHNYLIRAKTSEGLHMWIVRVHKMGNTLGICLPAQMRRTLKINNRDWFVLVATTAGTIEMKPLAETLSDLKFQGKQKCA